MDDLLVRLQPGLESRYRIDREVGRGGMAVVFGADDLRHDRRVAIKVLRPDLGDAIGAERFLREIAVSAQLSHPNILPLFDSGESGGLLYYVMPFVEGVTLRDRLKRDGPLPVREALQVTREVADALAFAHARGLVHRDVKPENILFQAGHAMLSDFGIARAVRVAGGDRLTESGLAIGTPLYMSPEQALGSGEVDARSDVFSLGCVLQEMLAGDPLVGPARTPASEGRPTPRPLDMPPSVAALIDAMTQRDPAVRLSTGEQLLSAIDTASTRAHERAPRTWVVRRAPAVAALAIVTIATLLWRASESRASSIRAIAVLPPQDLSGDSARRYVTDGVHDAVIGELAGVGALRVISRTSVARYRDGVKSVPEIARELGVDAVVEASITASPDRLAIRIHVVQASPVERDLGSDSFERPMRDALMLYRDVARAVATRVNAPVSSAEATRLSTARAVDPVAYDLYLRGLAVLREGATPADFNRGLTLLNQAIARDSTDPMPWAGLALAYDQIGHLSGQIPDAFDRARKAAANAQRLGGDLAEADAALAQTLLYDDWKPQAADSLFKRAISRNPSLAEAYGHYAWSLLLSGLNDSAFATFARAQSVDPLSALWPAFTASAASWVGRQELARAASRRALQVNATLPIAQYVHGTVLALDGDTAGAIAAERAAVARSPRWRFGLAYVLARTGHADEARQIAAELERTADGLDAWGLAETYGWLIERDKAFKWLDVAIAKRWNWVPWIDFNPAFAPLRGDPRYEAVLLRLGSVRCPTCVGHGQTP